MKLNTKCSPVECRESGCSFPDCLDAKSREQYDNCPTCRLGHGPDHDGSKSCKSGSIASGGTKEHCSCDTCFRMRKEYSELPEDMKGSDREEADKMIAIFDQANEEKS